MMPRFKVAHPDGRTITIEGDAPPNEQELDEIFASVGPKQAQPSQAPARATLGQRLGQGVQQAMGTIMPALPGVQGMGAAQQLLDMPGSEAAIDRMGAPFPGVGPIIEAGTKVGRGVSSALDRSGHPLLAEASRAILPQTPGQTLMALGTEGMVRGSGLLKPSVKVPQAPSLDSFAQRLIDVAKKYNIPLTAADMARTDTVIKLENSLKNTPIAGDLIAAFRKRQLSAIQEMADKIAAKSGNTASKEEIAAIANKARESALQSLQARRDQAYALYNSKLAEFDPAKVSADATRLESDLAVFAPDVVSAEGKQALLKIHGAIDTGIDMASSGQRYRDGQSLVSIEGIGEARRAIEDLVAQNKLGQPFMQNKEQRVFSRLGARISALESQAAKGAGQEAVDILSDARSLHSQGKKLVSFRSSKKLQAAVIEDGETASRLFDQFVAPNNATQLRAVRRVVGQKAFDNFGGRFVQNAIEAAGPEFDNPAAIVKYLDRFRKPGDNTLSILLPKETVAALDDLSTIIKGTRLDTKGFQGSAGAQFMKEMMGASAILSAGGATVGGPAGAAVGFGAAIAFPYGLGKLYLSEAGRKLLVRGFTIPAGTPEAAAWATRLGSYGIAKGLFSQPQQPQ